MCPGVPSWHPSFYFSQDFADVLVSFLARDLPTSLQLLRPEPTEKNSQARQLIVSFGFLICLQ